MSKDISPVRAAVGAAIYEFFKAQTPSAVVRVEKVRSLDSRKGNFEAEVTVYHPGVSQVQYARRAWSILMDAGLTRVLQAYPGALLPLPRFGVGDDRLSRCASHIYNILGDYGAGVLPQYSAVREASAALTRWGFTPQEFMEALESRVSAKFIYTYGLEVRDMVE